MYNYKHPDACLQFCRGVDPFYIMYTLLRWLTNKNYIYGFIYKKMDKKLFRWCLCLFVYILLLCCCDSSVSRESIS